MIRTFDKLHMEILLNFTYPKVKSIAVSYLICFQSRKEENGVITGENVINPLHTHIQRWRLEVVLVSRLSYQNTIFGEFPSSYLQSSFSLGQKMGIWMILP